jgi:hypothetical protein
MNRMLLQTPLNMMRQESNADAKRRENSEQTCTMTDRHCSIWLIDPHAYAES